MVVKRYLNVRMSDGAISRDELMKRAKAVLGVAVIWMVCSSGVGCSAYKPYTYHNDREEMPGPGLFSGEDGVFTIWGKSSEERPQDTRDENDDQKETPRENHGDNP